eukprot:TCALIF_10634-PA protein Name:"Similar to Nek1 Serine/threonine-protein kinase Nek1 (Mus musculus)" AED:0.10 eAED:0.10 QI:0/0.8/0.33/1/0.8/0.66/6/0/606
MERYQVQKKIGQGSFGLVHLARSKTPPADYVVIKEIKLSKLSRRHFLELHNDDAKLNNFKRLTTRISGLLFRSYFIVMKYCQGGDLYSKINRQRGRHFPEGLILKYFAQVCQALDYIHGQNILHRDIKSQNIFLTREDEVKLGDFGISRILDGTHDYARTCIGTPYYLSPEVWENRPYNKKSDIWALGCVLYEMTTLKHAFEAGCMKNLILKIIRGSYPAIPNRYSYDIRALIASMLKKNPKERPTLASILKRGFLQRCNQGLPARSNGRKLSPRTKARPKSAQTEDRPSFNSKSPLKELGGSRKPKSPNKRIARIVFKEDFPFLNFLRDERKHGNVKGKKTKKHNIESKTRVLQISTSLGQRKTKSQELSNRARLRHQQQKQGKASFGKGDPLKLTPMLKSPAGVAMWVEFGSSKTPQHKKRWNHKPIPEPDLHSETFTVEPSHLATITEEHDNRSKSGAFMRTIKKLMCTHESNIAVIESCTNLLESESNLSDQKSQSQSLPNLVTPDLLQSLDLDQTESVKEGDAVSSGLGDGIHGYLEEQRVLLEQKVGVGPLLKVYRLIEDLEESENEQIDYTDLKQILGPGHECYIDDIIQLVVADSFFQ